MIRTIALFFACLIATSGQELGLQVSIGTEQISPGIEGTPRQLTVIAVTISNPGDSPQSLVVGADYSNADHWNVTANRMTRDGKIIALSRLPRAVLSIGYLGPLVVEILAHGSYKALFDPRNFEEDTGHGGITNLAGIIGASGDQLQIVVHCGIFPNTNSWKGDLVSNWLKI